MRNREQTLGIVLRVVGINKMDTCNQCDDKECLGDYAHFEPPEMAWEIYETE